MKKFLRPRTVLAAVLFALLAFLLGAVLWNRGHARYEALPEADRFMLDEWNTYHQGTADQDLWEGFQLQERSILALNGSSGVGYLIQPSQPVRNPLAAKLAMPDGFAAEVYRSSPSAQRETSTPSERPTPASAAKCTLSNMTRKLPCPSPIPPHISSPF